MVYDIVVHNADAVILYAVRPGSPIDLMRSPAIIGGITIGDGSINAATCTEFPGINLPADYQPGWYTYTLQQGVQLTATGIAGQQAAAAAAIGAYKMQAIGAIGDPRNPAAGTALGNRLSVPISITIGGGAHLFSQDQVSELQVAMMALRGLVSVVNAKPWPANRKILTSDVPPAAVVITAQDMIDIGVAMADYVWDQKQYAAETISAILNPSVTTTAGVDAIVSAMVWPNS